MTRPNENGLPTYENVFCQCEGEKRHVREVEESLVRVYCLKCGKRPPDEPAWRSRNPFLPRIDVALRSGQEGKP